MSMADETVFWVINDQETFQARKLPGSTMRTGQSRGKTRKSRGRFKSYRKGKGKGTANLTEYQDPASYYGKKGKKGGPGKGKGKYKGKPGKGKSKGKEKAFATEATTIEQQCQEKRAPSKPKRRGNKQPRCCARDNNLAGR